MDHAELDNVDGNYSRSRRDVVVREKLLFVKTGYTAIVTSDGA